MNNNIQKYKDIISQIAQSAQDPSIKKSALKITENFEDDYGLVRELLDRKGFIEHYTAGHGFPSLGAIGAAGCEILNLNISPDMDAALMMAGVLGEIENNLPYHNNAHFRKVMLQLLCIVSVHRTIDHNRAQNISDKNIATMIIAACIHDFNHDGAGSDVYNLGAMEQKSFDAARPYFARLDKITLSDINIMLLCTDVNSGEGKDSLMNQMKAAYASHFIPGAPKNFHLDDRLLRLKDDRILSLMCLLLHEADIATSAGINYEITKSETGLYAAEIGQPPARPSHIIGFFEGICGGAMMSNAARSLYGDCMQKIYAQAQADMMAGDLPF